MSCTAFLDTHFTSNLKSIIYMFTYITKSYCKSVVISNTSNLQVFNKALQISRSYLQNIPNHVFYNNIVYKMILEINRSFLQKYNAEQYKILQQSRRKYIQN